MSHAKVNSVSGRVPAPQQLIEEQLEQLQLQINRLREQLLSPPSAAEFADKLLLKVLVQEILRSRRRRERIFGGELFGEPAWDILLELFSAELTQQKLSVSSTCYASAVPYTTALRWVTKLEQDGWIERKDDPVDGRRSWLTLTDQGSGRMRQFFGKLTIRPIGNGPNCSRD